MLFRVADGKIIESWQEIDALGLMVQLGVVREPGKSPLGFMGWAVATVFRMAFLTVRAKIRGA